MSRELTSNDYLQGRKRTLSIATYIHLQGFMNRIQSRLDLDLGEVWEMREYSSMKILPGLLFVITWLTKLISLVLSSQIR